MIKPGVHPITRHCAENVLSPLDVGNYRLLVIMRPKYFLPLVLFFFAASSAASAATSAGNLPACNSRFFTHQGNRIQMSLSSLAQRFNQRLRAAHANFQNLRLITKGPNQLEVSGEKNGQPASVIGRLTPTRSGGLQLHADQIMRNGKPVKGAMDLFGKDLAGSVNLRNTPSLSASGNNLEIDVDSLLGVAGHVTNVHLQTSQIEMKFASPPCR